MDIAEADLTFYCHISAQAYGEQEDVMMEQDCFLYETEQEITPSNEIGAVAYFDRESYSKEPMQVVGVIQVLDKLELDGILRTD